MKRKLSAVESLVWADGTMPVYFALTARLQGDFSLEAFEAALAKVRRRHPLTAGRIVKAADGVWYEMDGVPDFCVRITSGDWAAELIHSLTELFPADSGPLVRFSVIRNGEWTDVVMVSHHAIADGLAAAYVLRDLLRFMADPDLPVEPLPVLPPLEEMLPPLAGTTDGGAMQAPELVSVLDRSEAQRLLIWRWSLPAAATAGLVARCRQEGTSVHAALCAAFLSAYAPLDGGSTLRGVSSPLNLRDQMQPPAGEQFGFFIQGGIKTRLDCLPGRDFWEMAREVKASMAAEMNKGQLFAQFHVMKHILTQVPYDVLARSGMRLIIDYDLSITNLGRLDFPVEIGPLRLEGVFGPTVNSSGERILGVTTAAGRMTFTLIAPLCTTSPDLAQTWKALAGQQLARAIGWEGPALFEEIPAESEQGE